MLLLYLPPESTRLAEYRIREVSAGEAVCLVDGGGDPDRIRNLRNRYPQIREVIPASGRDRESLREQLAPFETDTICLPVAPETLDLHFAPPMRLPAILPFYELIRDFRRAGLRRFELYSFAGRRMLCADHLLHEFAGRHRGRRAFVIGNGPSLNRLDMSRLQGEITFGSNRGYLGFEKWGFHFNYWGCSDRLQIEEYLPEYEAYLPGGCVKIFPFEYLPMAHFENTCPVRMILPEEKRKRFSSDPDRLFRGSSVTYILLQAAVIMGCNPIILVGVDHRYPINAGFPLLSPMNRTRRRLARHFQHTTAWAMGEAAWWAFFNRSARMQRIFQRLYWDTKDVSAETHFDSSYAGRESRKFLLPSLKDVARDFAHARQWADQHDISILNATPDSALSVFEQVEWEGLF